MTYKIFKKLVLVLVIISLFPFPSLAMKKSPSSVEEGSAPPKFRLSFDPPKDKENFGQKTGHEQEFETVMESHDSKTRDLEEVDGLEESSFQESKHSSFKPMVSFFVRDPKHETIASLNRFLEQITQADENTSLIDPHAPSYVTALTIFRTDIGENEDDFSWDNPSLFLETLDEVFYDQSTSKKTIVLMCAGTVIGCIGAVAMGPMVPYLSAPLIRFIPVGGNLALGMFVTDVIITGFPFGNAMANRLKRIGNVVFDGKGFKPSKSDKKPHIQKLEIVRERGCQKCCSEIPIEGPSRVFSLTIASLRTAPFALLYWQAEAIRPDWNWMVGFLAAVVFEKTYEQTMRFCRKLAHSRLTEAASYMLVQKKRILIERLRANQKFMNADKSDAYVKALYALREERVDQGNEKISRFSSLFLKHVSRQGTGSMDISEIVDQSEVSLNLSTVHDLSMMAEQRQKMETTIDNISYHPSKPVAEEFLENVAILGQGSALPGRWLVTFSTISSIISLWGGSPDVSFWIGAGIATGDVFLRTFSEWYIQKESMTSLQKIGSTKTDYWGARWFTSGLSALSSAFYALPAAAIITTITGTTPQFIKWLIVIATLPSEFNSFFDFFTKKWGNIITGTAKLLPNCKNIKNRTIRQQRSILNQDFERAVLLIEEADQNTVESMYSYFLDGL